MYCAFDKRFRYSCGWCNANYASHIMESVVPSQCGHIEIDIVKYELGEAIEAMGGLIARQ